jgi:hypothetical protein
MTFAFICVTFLIIGFVSPEFLHFCDPSYREALGYSLQLVTHKSSSGTQSHSVPLTQPIGLYSVIGSLTSLLVLVQTQQIPITAFIHTFSRLV